MIKTILSTIINILEQKEKLTQCPLNHPKTQKQKHILSFLNLEPSYVITVVADSFSVSQCNIVIRNCGELCYLICKGDFKNKLQ